MADIASAIDISTKPDVLEIVRRVVRSGRPQVLRHGREALVVITPYSAEPAGATPGAEFLERAAGTWPHDVAEKLKADIRESREVPSEPPVHL